MKVGKLINYWKTNSHTETSDSLFRHTTNLSHTKLSKISRTAQVHCWCLYGTVMRNTANVSHLA